MRRGIQRASILAGLAVLGATLAGGREAWAEGLLPSITIGGGIVQGSGDPTYIYEMNVYLVNASISYAGSGPATSFFTINGLVGVTPPGFPIGSDTGSMTTQRELPPSVVWTPSINLAGSTSPYASDVTWSYFGNNPISTSDTLFLGSFTVETTQSFPVGDPPIPVGSTITYTYTINDSLGSSTTNSGSFILNAVPEPSSVILLLAGGAGLPLLIFRARRLRERRAA